MLPTAGAGPTASPSPTSPTRRRLISPIILVAMAPSGETFITRDSGGRLWLHQPEGAGGAGPIDQESALRAVADHGFEPLDREFADWASLDDFRQERAAQVTPAVVVNVNAFDLEDVDRLLAVGRDWKDEGDLTGAWRLVRELLRVPAVRADATALETLADFLAELSKPQDGPPPVSTSPAKARARERWQRVTNAA